MITSTKNQQLKNVKKLLDAKRARDDSGLFVCEGERLVKEIPYELIEQIYISQTFYKNMESSEDEFLKKLKASEKYEVVVDEIFKSISDTRTPQGILAVVKKPENSFEDLICDIKNNADAKLLILDNVRDPGNIGTIIRTSEAAGVTGLILSAGCADIYNPKVVRSTMGSIFRVKIISGNLSEIIPELKNLGVEIYGSALKSSKDYREVTYGAKHAFIVGNEANGISDEVLSLTTQNIKIPMAGKVESLNAAISAAVLLFSN